MTTTATEPSPPRLVPDSVAACRRVVVGRDDSDASLTALRFAAREAPYRAGDVPALGVWHYPYTSGLPTVWPEDADPSEHITSHLQQRVAATLAKPAAAAEPIVSIGVEVEPGTRRYGIGGRRARRRELVLGARQHNRLLGSVGQVSTKPPPYPVVIVRAVSRPA